MTFKYGAGESLYAEAKQHREEQQWSPAVFFDRPRCILCYRCVRMCGEGMDVWALGIQNRGVSSVIAPNRAATTSTAKQCGMCIDVCPVGALTSGTYRYKTRPWEMNHVSTVCTHCGDGCKITLGVRQSNDGSEIVRADNRDKSGINGDFLCTKGRFGFDFVENPERLTQPLVRNAARQARARHLGARASTAPARSSRRFATRSGGKAIGVIGSNRTTNEENYLLQKFARTVLAPTTSTTSAPPITSPLLTRSPATKESRQPARHATAPAILLVGGDPTNEHPLLAWNLRTNVRLNRARLYIANHRASSWTPGQGHSAAFRPHGYSRSCTSASSITTISSTSREAVMAEESLLIVFGSEFRGNDIEALVALGLDAAATCASPSSATTPTPAAPPTWACFPTCFPATCPLPPRAPSQTNIPACRPRRPRPAEIFDAAGQGELSALCSSSAPIPSRRPASIPRPSRDTFVIVQDMFLTETAALADVVLPAANLYEKSGTVTNTFGDVQLVNKAADRPASHRTSRCSFASPTRWAPTSKRLFPSAKAGVTRRSWASPAAPSPAKPTVTPSGSPPTTSSRSSAPSIRSPSSTRFSASFPATI